MHPADGMRILGLSATASRHEIKRAYRRLALKLHPDKHQGDEAVRRRFVELSEAYRALMRATRGRDRDREIGVCRSCGQFTEVFRSLEGVPACERCILRPKGMRFLPLPRLIVVKCVVSIMLNAVAGVCLITAFGTGALRWAAAAFGAGLLGLVSLAITCLSVRHCTSPAETAMYRRFGKS